MRDKFRGAYTVLDSNKYYVDELYGAAIVKPILGFSRVVLWRFIDAGLIDSSITNSAHAVRDVGGGVREMQSGNIRSYAGWVARRSGRGHCLHGLEGRAMRYPQPEHSDRRYISAAARRDPAGFLPAPRSRHSLLRLGISLLTLLLSLHLPWHYVRGQAGFQFEQNVPWITPSEHSLPLRR